MFPVIKTYSMQKAGIRNQLFYEYINSEKNPKAEEWK